MAGYTLKNLREIDDMAPRFGYAPHVEARFARTALECGKTEISYFRIAPGFRMPFGHRHAEQEEIYLLTDGGGRIKLDDEVVELRAWDFLRVSPETTRCFEAGPEGAEMIAFGAPRTDNADIEVVPEWWSG